MFTRRQALWLSAAFFPYGFAASPFCLARNDSGLSAAQRQQRDVRLGPAKTLNDYFPFTPPKTRDEWERRRQELREQVLVSQGLWPMPVKSPLNPVIHGRIEREGYTVEKVYFASMPGHYVCGNLYRPTARTESRRPAILCPHGHWANGRFYQAPDATIERDLKLGAETDRVAARSPLQTRCVHLARLGFVVFHYDMIGYADSQALPHRQGFNDAEAELRLQSVMGLQTWNSIRALDFLESLPDVDRTRIGVTGASGGGTQTFMLCAIDDRPAAAFPAVMVSTAMQGGCVCENCSYLRIGTGNVELAALFAPKPLAMSAANDWTREILTKGLPELKQVYRLYGKEENVAAEAWLDFPHNFSQPSREFMYSWFAKHLLGKTASIREQPYVPIDPKELSVFDADHPRPTDELTVQPLRQQLTQRSDADMAALAPRDAASYAEFRRIIGTALRVMLQDRWPVAVEACQAGQTSEIAGCTHDRWIISRPGEGDAVPVVRWKPRTQKVRQIVIWLHPQGIASTMTGNALDPIVKSLLDAGSGVVAFDPLGVGQQQPEKPFTVNPQYSGLTWGYNRPLLANQVRDLLSTLAFIHSQEKNLPVHLAGFSRFGPLAVLGLALAGAAIAKTAVDLDKFDFADIQDVNDARMLPGAVKYGGLGNFLALCAPAKVLAFRCSPRSDVRNAQAAYRIAGNPDHLRLQTEAIAATDLVRWLCET